MRSEVIKELAMSFKGTPAEFAEEICQIEAIESKLSELDKIKKAEMCRHSKAIQSIIAKRNDVENQCGHKVTKFYGDPSGGNDTWTQCQICGKSV